MGISRLGAPRGFRYWKDKNISAVLPLPRDKCCLKVQLGTLRPQYQSERLPLEEEMTLKNGRNSLPVTCLVILGANEMIF